MAQAGEGERRHRRSGGRPIDRSAVAEPHRSVYLPMMRGQLPEVLTLFDFADATVVAGERATTTVPAQALFLMNNAWVIGQAEAGRARNCSPLTTATMDASKHG